MPDDVFIQQRLRPARTLVQADQSLIFFYRKTMYGSCKYVGGRRAWTLVKMAIYAG